MTHTRTLKDLDPAMLKTGSITKSIRISQELSDKVQGLADQEGRSFNNMVVWILTKYFKR